MINCKHVYEYVYSKICPHCGSDTHEPDHEKQHDLFVEYYKSEAPKAYLCPVDGGTIRGWWSI